MIWRSAYKDQQLLTTFRKMIKKFDKKDEESGKLFGGLREWLYNVMFNYALYQFHNNLDTASWSPHLS